jgi:hemolysin III
MPPEPELVAVPESARRRVSHPTPMEELVHALTHGVGAVLSLMVLAALVARAAASGSSLHVATASVFGLSLVAVYASSTVYHAIPPRHARAKALSRIVDHAAIHLLIAGTYTPLVLVGVGGVWGASLTAIAWTLALAGIVIETTSLRHRARLSLAMYLGTGWFGAVALPLLWSRIPGNALALLVLGGVAYTAGVPFFLVEGRRWMHAAWHGFVLAGSALHVGAVVLVVV